MLKTEIYPKTQRLSCSGIKVQVTEKLDGSNLVFFKLNNELYFAQRSTIFNINEMDEYKQMLYGGLYGWLTEHKDKLLEELYEGSAICGEWLGMGKIKYSCVKEGQRYFMFAKANITPDFKLTNIKYDHDLFIYPFITQQIPDFINIIPVVRNLNHIPFKEELDALYEEYTNSKEDKVEGFVVNYENKILKYVRMKNGKLTDHFDWENKK